MRARHAIACGELLIEAKRRFGKYGEWRPWLTAHCSVSARSAHVYMALARRLKQLTDENGGVLPISLGRPSISSIPSAKATGENIFLRHRQRFGSATTEPCPWGVDWGIAETLIAITRIRDPANGTLPKPSTVAKAARDGRTPGLTPAPCGPRLRS